MAQEFRTVEYQGQRAERQGYIAAPSGQAALDANADFQQRQIVRAQEGVNQANQMALRNNERLDAVAIDNQRLVAAQSSARNEAVLRSTQMLGEQRLRNMQLRDGWQSEVQRLRLTHQTMRDEFNTRLNSQQTESLTQLGSNIAQFSSTLWKQQAEGINKRNQEVQAQGLMDELMGFGSTTIQDLSKVDVSQYQRLARQGENALVANQLEQNGRPVDATRIRSDNPFYLYGRSEGQVLKAQGELPAYLTKVKQEAQDSGLLVKGDPNADVALGVILNTAARKFFVEKGLTGIAPAVVAKYMGDTLIRSQALITKEFNAENRAYVKDAQKQVALGQAQLAFETIGQNPAEAAKNISQVLNAAGTDGLDDLFRGFVLQANQTGNRAPIDNLMLDPRMAYKVGEYSQFQQQWQETAARNADKANKEYAQRIEGSFLAKLSEANPGDVPGIREEFTQLARTLPIELAGPLLDKISKTSIADASSANTALDDIIELTPPAQLPAAIARFKAENPTLPNSVVQKADKALKAFEKAMSPDAQQALEEAQSLVLGTIDPKTTALRKINPTADQQINAIVKARKEELVRRAKVYFQRPGASVDGFRNWLQQNNQDLIKKPISADANGNFPELGQRAKPTPTSSAAPVPVTPYRNRNVTFFVTQNERNKLIQGHYGRVNATKAIVLTPNEVQAAAVSYEAGNGHLALVKQLAGRVGMTPEALIMNQAALHGMPGRLEPPKDTRQTSVYQRGTGNGQQVKPDYARSFALSAGLSQRGATWFATIIKDESGGNPNALHDSDAQGNPTGFGLFGHRNSRRESLFAFAKQRGMPPSDPLTQMEFAISEIKTSYPSVWTKITAPNPTSNQLWTAMKDWLRFSETVHTRRYNSLLNALGQQ